VPIAKLFIEGNLESEVLNPILQGNPVLQRGGSKYSLRPRALAERRENRVAAGYLRDRDFDHDPPADITKPTVDSEADGVTIGWRWCRHEMENYLIDPAIVSAAMGWPIADFEQALFEGARKIRDYQVARWTIGVVRRTLPPHYELRTRPQELNEIDLPTGLDAASVSTWAFNSIEAHRGPIVAATNPETLRASLEFLAARFDEGFLSDITSVLVWFSGKDLLASMAEWLARKGFQNPGAFRASVRDWIIATPVRAVELLPEWAGMVEVVRS
jgi:hypothetical protein